MSEDCHNIGDSGYQDTNYLTDDDLALLDEFSPPGTTGLDTLKLCLRLMDTFEEDATEIETRAYSPERLLL